MPEFIERFFGTSIPEDITFDNVRRFVSEGIEENQNLEYKPRGLLVKADDTLVTTSDLRQVIGFSALAKSIAGFANAAGGLLLLGVKEKAQRYKGTTVKVRPGAITPIPPTVTREMINTQLATKIQFPIENISIFPIRKSSRSNHSVYLIDVPQSNRAPHRVNEIHYYQRYNFDVLEMKHFQIADMFGRRKRPSLTLFYRFIRGVQPSSLDEATTGRIIVGIQNSGLGIAKFPYLSLEISKPYHLCHYGLDGNMNEGLPRMAEADRAKITFGASSDQVIHPKSLLSVAAIEIRYKTGMRIEDLRIDYDLTAEDAELTTGVLQVSGEELRNGIT